MRKIVMIAIGALLATTVTADAAKKKQVQVNVAPNGAEKIVVKQGRKKSTVVNVAAPTATVAPSQVAVQVQGRKQKIVSVNVAGQPTFVNSQLLVQPAFRGQVNAINSFTVPTNNFANIRYVSHGHNQVLLTAPPITRTFVQEQHALTLPGAVTQTYVQPQQVQQVQVQHYQQPAQVIQAPQASVQSYSGVSGGVVTTRPQQVVQAEEEVQAPVCVKPQAVRTLTYSQPQVIQSTGYSYVPQQALLIQKGHHHRHAATITTAPVNALTQPYGQVAVPQGTIVKEKIKIK